MRQEREMRQVILKELNKETSDKPQQIEINLLRQLNKELQNKHDLSIEKLVKDARKQEIKTYAEAIDSNYIKTKPKRIPKIKLKKEILMTRKKI